MVAFKSSAHEQNWRREMESAHAAIPAEFVLTFSDGFQGINPQYNEHPLVRYYLTVQQVGYANGWMT
jgi:hypothetical protein